MKDALNASQTPNLNDIAGNFSELSQSIKDFHQLRAMLRAISDAAKAGRIMDVGLLADAGMLLADAGANHLDCLIGDFKNTVYNGNSVH